MSKKPVKSQAPKGSLQRQLSPMHVWAIAFGCVIGWGSFINPGKKFLANSGVAGTAIAMILGAIVMIIIAFSYAYMVPKYPKAGGEFTFTKNCFGKTLAFICGWFLVAAYLTNVPMNSTAIALIIDGLTGHKGILNFGFHYTLAGTDIYLGQMLPAMTILILFGWLNIIGVKKAGFVQTILASLLVICVFVLFISALISAKAQNINMAPIWGFDKAAAMAAEIYKDYNKVASFQNIEMITEWLATRSSYSFRKDKSHRLQLAITEVDTETETAIMEAVDALHGQKTLVIIAHRLRTIENCDIIYEVKEGKICRSSKDSIKQQI